MNSLLEAMNCRRLFLGLILVLAVAISACTDETINNVMPEPAGTEEVDFTARVSSYPAGLILAGAEFRVLGTEYDGAANAEGIIELPGMPVGSYMIAVSDTGHTTALVAVDLTAATAAKANRHVHREIVLLENSGVIELTVYGENSSVPLVGVPVAIQGVAYPEGAVGHTIMPDDLAERGLTDESGFIRLVGLPATEVTLLVGPYTEADAAGSQYGPMLVTVPVPSGGSVSRSAVMTVDTGDWPTLVSSNLPTVDYGRIAEDYLYLTFSEPMSADSLLTEVRIWDRSEALDIPVSYRWTSAVKLEVWPVDVLWDYTKQYDIVIIAHSVQGELYRNKVLRTYWYWDPAWGAEPCEEPVGGLARTPGSPPIDFDTVELSLDYPALPCAVGYEIYARDDNQVTDWRLIQVDDSDYDSGTITSVVRLPAEFDRYHADAVQTPFAATAVEFCVIPRFVDSPGRFDAAPKLTLVDEVGPRIVNIQQEGAGFNQTDLPHQMVLHFAFSEFVAADVADPVLEAVEPSGLVPTQDFDPTTAVWTWGPGRISGTFVVSLPPHSFANFDLVRGLFTDFFDLSGIGEPGLHEAEYHEITDGGAVFDFEDGIPGWAISGTIWSISTPMTGPLAAHSGSQCFGTSFIGGYSSGAAGALNTPKFMVPETDPIVSFWVWNNLDYAETVKVMVNEAGVSRVFKIFQRYGNQAWTQYVLPLDTYAGREVKLIFLFETTRDYDGGEFYLDDVMVDATRLDLDY